MTNIYTFPPITSGDELERINAQERQVGVLCLPEWLTVLETALQVGL